MGKDPTIPFYAQDFYMDTLQWNENEVGAYIRLLCSLWINGFCYNSAIELANISPLAKQVVDKYPDKFIFYDDNKFSSKRLEIERDKRIKHRELRSIAGKKGAESRWQTDSKDYGKKITKVNEKENEYNNDIKNIVHEFYEFQETKHKGQLNGWRDDINLINDSCDVIDKLQRLDGFNLDDIKMVLRNATKDEFWSGVIISLRGLRNKGKNKQTKFQNASAKLLKGDVWFEWEKKYGTD